MSQAVELGSHLSNLTAEQFVIRDHLVGAIGFAGGQSGNHEAEMTFAWQRHSVFIDTAKVVDFAVAYQVASLSDFLGRDPIGRATLIIRAEFRGPPLGADGSWVAPESNHQGGATDPAREGQDAPANSR
jgi:hypothetical protein